MEKRELQRTLDEWAENIKNANRYSLVTKTGGTLNKLYLSGGFIKPYGVKEISFQDFIPDDQVLMIDNFKINTDPFKGGFFGKEESK